MERQNLQVSEVSTVAIGDRLDSCETTEQLPSAAEIQNWIVAYLAELMEIDSYEIEIGIPFDRYGLDSSIAVGMTGDLEDWLERELDPTLLYDYPTIEALAQHLAEEISADN